MRSLVDQEKIIIMTKLAIYEKRHMRKDKKKLDYFIEDYIYVRNFLVRLGITLIFFFNIAVGGFKSLNNDFVFPTSVESFIEIYIVPYFWPWLMAIIIYTVITTFISGIEYRNANLRFNEYKKLLKRLEEHENHQAAMRGADNEI